MGAKRFHISTPEELKALAEYAKETPNRLTNIIRVWTAVKRKDGKTRWDNAIYCGFSGDRTRIAEIVRFTSDNELEYCASLKYNLALNWCEKHLQEVYDT